MTMLLPARPPNPPGETSLSWQLGTQQDFFEAMLAAIPRISFDSGPGADIRPLAALTARDLQDPTIALINAWAVIGDIVSFYEERILNEGFVSTAHETQSLLLIADGMGYQPAQYVGASAMLAVTVEPPLGDAPDAPVAIPSGSSIQSVPPEGQSVQHFETVAAATATSARNAVAPVRTRPQVLDASSLSLITDGTAAALNPGDSLLFVDQLPSPTQWLRVVVTALATDDQTATTTLSWALPLGTLWQQAGHATPWPFGPAPLILGIGLVANLFGYDAPDWSSQPYSVQAAATPPGFQPQDFKTWPGYGFDPGDIDLSEVYSEILPGSLILLEEPTQDLCGTIEATAVVPEAAFTLTGEVTQVETGPLAAWQTRRSLLPGRVSATATLLRDGTILIIGGSGPDGTALATTQIYDPATGALTFGPPLPGPRSGHSATLLPDGSLAVIGGSDGTTVLASVLQLSFSGANARQFITLAATLATPCTGHQATSIPGGGVLVTGGFGASGQPLAAAQLFDPASLSFGAALAMTTARANHTATAYLLSGSAYVLVAGGTGSSGALASGEIYVPGTGFVALAAAMPSARQLHAANAVPSSSGSAVVLTGGQGSDGTAATPTTLVFTPSSTPANGSFAAPSGQIAPGRWSHAALTLQDGSIFVAGGFVSTGTPTTSCADYAPASGIAQTRAPLPAAQAGALAVTLPSGLAWFAGGTGATPALDTAYTVDPDLDTFIPIGSLPVYAGDGASAVLPNRNMLATGGYGMVYLGGGASTGIMGALTEAALYDPVEGIFTPTGPMNTARYQHTATLLGNGTVLVAGGQLAPTDPDFSSILKLLDDAQTDNAQLLPVAAQINLDASAIYTTVNAFQNALAAPFSGEVALYTSVDWSHTWYVPCCWVNHGCCSADMNEWTPYYNVPASLGTGVVNGNTYVLEWSYPSYEAFLDASVGNDLPSLSQVLVQASEIEELSTGSGVPPQFPLSIDMIEADVAADLTQAIAEIEAYTGAALFSAEIYNPSTASFAASGTMAYVRWQHTATLLPDGRVLLVGGTGFPASALTFPVPPGQILANAEIYDPGDGSFTLLAAQLPQPTCWHSATLLGNGLVLIAGGMSSSTEYLTTALLFDPATAQFAAIQPMLTARARHAAVLQPDGSVLMAGGFTTGGTATNAAELFQPDAGLFAKLPPMLEARAALSAELLPDGTTLLAGGFGSSGAPLANAEIYQPASGSFAGPIPMTQATAAAVAARLPDGGVAVAGGYAASSGTPIMVAEIFVAEPFVEQPELRRSTRIYTATEPVPLAPLPDPTPIGGARIRLPIPAPQLAAGDNVIVQGPPPFAILSGVKALVVANAALGEAQSIAAGDTVLVLALGLLPEGLGQFTLTLIDGFTGTAVAPVTALQFQLAAAIDPATAAAFARAPQAEPATIRSCRTVASDSAAIVTLTAPLAQLYDRQDFVLLANIVEAAQGVTVTDEILGSGDGKAAFQTFELGQYPVTNLPRSDGTGVASSVEIRVNALLWQRAPSLAAAGPTDQVYVLTTDLAGRVRVTFGDAVHGSRLPTGIDNVTASYRYGAGAEGNVPAGLLSVPPPQIGRVSAVTNPLPASGGIGMVPAAALRVRIPSSVQPLDRVVSLADYRSFAFNFPGIARAQAVIPPKGPSAPSVFVTIAGTGGVVPTPDSANFQALQAAITAAQVPGTTFALAGYGRRYFDVAATVGLDPRYSAASLLDQLTALLAAAYGFDRRGFGDPVRASDIMTQLQAVPGVTSVQLTQLHESDRPDGLWPILTPRPVRWQDGVLQPAEILLVNPSGIALVEAST